LPLIGLNVRGLARNVGLVSINPGPGTGAVEMWGEVRYTLAMAGSPGVTIGAFCALLLYGLVSLVRRDADISRLSAGILLSVATL
jgi:hypothetical protein